MTNNEIECANASSAGVLALSIGDIRIALISHEPDLMLHVQRAMKCFVVDSADADIIVRALWGELHDPLAGSKTFDSGGLWRLYQQDSIYLFSLTSPAFGALPYK